MIFESRRPISPILAPFAIGLVIVVVGPFLAELIAGLFTRSPNSPDDLSAYVHNDRVYLAALTATTFVVAGSLSWLFARLEGLRGSMLATHVRQCALIYAYLAINLGSAIHDRLSGNVWMCFACPPPWQFIAPAALIANFITLVPVRMAGGLTRA